MNEAASIHQGDARSVRKWSKMLKGGAMIGGGALAIFGLSRRSKSGIGIAAAGGLLTLIAAKSGEKRASIARSSIVLNSTPQQAYQFWRNFENLPQFMRHLESVTVLDKNTSRWTAIGPLGKHIHWQAEIISDRENEAIAWHSLPGSDVNIDGLVKFQPAPGNRGTILRVHLLYRPPVGALGRSFAKLLGKDPGFLIQQDLRRLKALIEAGEIPTVEGQSHGPRSSAAAMARLLSPDRPIRGRIRLPEALEAQRRVS